jgi:hypothetical protein
LQNRPGRRRVTRLPATSVLPEDQTRQDGAGHDVEHGRPRSKPPGPPGCRHRPPPVPPSGPDRPDPPIRPVVEVGQRSGPASPAWPFRCPADRSRARLGRREAQLPECWYSSTQSNLMCGRIEQARPDARPVTVGTVCPQPRPSVAPAQAGSAAHAEGHAVSRGNDRMPPRWPARQGRQYRSGPAAAALRTSDPGCARSTEVANEPSSPMLTVPAK